MICEKPIPRGGLKGEPATGTTAGYQRHRRAREPACPQCLAAQYDANPPRSNRDWFDRLGNLTAVWCRCANCGAAGKANPRVLMGQRVVWSCSGCRDV
jgi:hypothetical protein